MLVPLRDGRQVRVREVQAQDKDAMRAAFEHLSAQARYTRFMAPLRELSEATLDAATHPVPGREFALVAVDAAGGAATIVAGARYVGAGASATCEFALTVADDWSNQGLAGRLLPLLIEHATAHGLHCMEGYVLASNTPMRRLARRLGFADAPCPDDPGLRIVRLDLAAGGCHP
jgi:GNAT superfamily N-acetyltransferase